MQILKNEDGAFAIDAIFGITLFMISILSIMFMVMIVRVQSSVQYALGQTAKEISGYYYLIDKVGLAKFTAEKNTSEINTTIGYVLDFADAGKDMSEDLTKINITDGLSSKELEILKDQKASAEQLADIGRKLGNQVKTLSKDPKSQIVALLSVFANKAISHYIAPYVCQAIMPRYMAGDLESTNEMLESVGVEGGLAGMDFTHSELLKDGRSIKLVVVYKLNPEKITFGMVKNSEMTFRQVVSTAAWVVPNGNSLKALKDIK